jgi:hypothetical protein
MKHLTCPHVSFPYKSVLATYNKEKIESFARLFNTSNATSNKDKLTVDQYEELLNILIELSDVEMKILITLEKSENTIPEYKTSNPKEKYKLAKGFWNGFENEFSHVVSREDITARLARLQRTGLYESFSNGYVTNGGGAFSGHAITDTDPKGFLTSLYYKLKEYALN